MMARPVRSRPGLWARLASEPKLWAWAALSCTLLVCALLLGVYSAHQVELNRAGDVLDSIRKARIDLAKASLKVELSRDPEMRASDVADGAALTNQALESLIATLESAVREGATEMTGALEELRASAEYHRAELRKLAGGGGDRSDLRASYGALERLAETTDTLRRQSLHALRERARWAFLTLISGAVALLAVVCAGVFVAGREQYRASQRIRLAADATGVDYWDEEIGTGRLFWQSDHVAALGGAATPATFAELVAGAASAADRSCLEEARLAAIAGRPARLVEVRFLLPGVPESNWTVVKIVTTGEAGGASRRLSGVIVDVTARKMEEAARKQEEAARGQMELRFRHLFDIVPVGLIYARRDGTLISFNRRTGALLGYELEDISPIDRWWARAYPDPDYRRFVQEDWQRDVAQAGEAGVDIRAREYRVRIKSGRTRTMEFSGTVIGEELLIVVDDVTERREAEEKMKFHEAVLEETGRIAKVGGWSLDPVSGEGYWTREVALIHDLDPNAPPSREIGVSFYAPEYRARIEAAVEGAIQRGEPYDLQLELVSAKGVRKWVRTIGHPVIEGGKVVRLRGSFQDITSLRQAEDSLREREELFRQMAENIREVFWIWDFTENRYLYVSPAFERVCGRSCQSLLDNPGLWLELVVAEDRERVRGEFVGSRTDPLQTEYRIVRADGSVRWIADRGYPVCGPDGVVQRRVGVAADVTDTRVLEEQFLRAQRLEAVGTLAGGVAHDLNNILSPIMMMGVLLREKLTEPGDQRVLSLVEQAAQRGAAIVSQLLVFSRGSLSGEMVELRVEHLVSEVSHLLAETFPRGISIRREIAPDVPLVCADPTRIHQVLMNLCVNARDAMPGGGVLVLGVRAEQVTPEFALAHGDAMPGSYVVLSVSDTGTGISEAVRQRMFDPFFTTKELGKGTGLGLSTVLGIVRTHRGFIAITSGEGKGAKFEVFLPATLAAATVQDAAGAARVRGNGETILVVDDEESVRTTIKAALENSGFRVQMAASGAEALAAIQAAGGGIDLLLSDVMMPGMDGWELVRRVQLDAPAQRVVLCTGLDQEVSAEDLAQAGVSVVLAKPPTIDALLSAVRRGLGTI